MAEKNYTLEAKWKIGRIIARQGRLFYRIQVGSDILKRRADQITIFKYFFSELNKF